MATKEWERLENLFHATLQLEVADRSEYLMRECSGDEELRRKVESLVTASQDAPAFIETPALSLGLRVLSGESNNSLIGMDVGPYKITSALGKGGMGVVYLADDSRLGRKVALKFLSGEFVANNWAKRQLIKEAQAVAMLDHPNICQVYGIEEYDGRSFIVMQYVEGETLSDLIRARRLDPAEIVPLARQIVGALAEAHAHGIIHRDIKPKNIMVTPGGQVKVLDFGLAKTIQKTNGIESPEESISQLSQNGVLAGTVAYMSPEQLRGERLDYRTDIFSLGIILYELIDGRRPFACGSEAETISAILTAEPSPLKNRGVESDHLSQVVYKCLCKERDGRYQSASGLLLELTSPARTTERQNPFLKPWLAPAAATLVLIIAVVLVHNRLPGYPPVSQQTADGQRLSSPRAQHSLAVLPVSNRTVNNNVDYLGQGLTETLINKFSSLSTLRVSSYTSVYGYKSLSANPQSIGQELGVDAIMLGEIIQKNDSLVLRMRLVKTLDGSEMWTDEKPIDWPHIFELVNQLAKNVTDSLALRLEGEAKFVAAHGTSSPDAFKQYMLGRYFWRNRDKENIQKAIAFFKEAIRLDPLYARAYAGLADSYVLLSTVSFGKTPTAEAMTQASAAAKEALSIDDNLAEAHTSMGVVNLRYDWDWAGAEYQFRRAIELKPDYAPAHYWYSHLLLITGRQKEAVSESSKAKDLDPFSPPSKLNYCRTLSVSHQFGDAVSCFDKLVKENPDSNHIKYLLALVYEQSGRKDEAMKIFERIYAKDPALAGAALGYVYGKAGRIAEAKHVLEEMFHLAKKQYVPPWEFSIIYVGLGDLDNAFAWLERAFEERFATFIYLPIEPLFESLWSDPRYGSLVARLKLPQ